MKSIIAILASFIAVTAFAADAPKAAAPAAAPAPAKAEVKKEEMKLAKKKEEKAAPKADAVKSEDSKAQATKK